MKTGALSIGQSPRRDLVGPLRVRFPAAEFLEAGALDHLDAGELPPVTHARFPLGTRLRDGTRVTVAQDFLEEHLQGALEKLELEGAEASILLCAGTFSSLVGTKPLIKPFDAARNYLKVAGVKRVGLIAPIKEQIEPLLERWRAAGFDAVAWAADVARPDAPFTRLLERQVGEHQLKAILLDYVGHPADVVDGVAAVAPVPVFDSGRLAVEALSNLL